MFRRTTITEPEFNLITTAIQGLLANVGFTSKLEEKSTHFAVLGTVIFAKQLNINCRPVAGEWYLHHPTEQSIMGIGSAEGECAGREQATFHTWIQTETHIIDLMSPTYPEMYPASDGSSRLPRRMLQLPISDDAKNWEEFQKGAPLFTLPNVELTNALMTEYATDPRCEDLAQAFVFWWQKLIADPKATFVYYPRRGEGLPIARNGQKANGVWQGHSRRQ